MVRPGVGGGERCTKDGGPAALGAHLQGGGAVQLRAAAQARSRQPGLRRRPVAGATVLRPQFPQL